MTPTPDIYDLALALTPGINLLAWRKMQQHGITSEAFFRLPRHRQVELTGGSQLFRRSEKDASLGKARTELDFIARHSIRAIFCDDADYPQRLAQCPDAPLMLFVLGGANLNPEHGVSIVGTRGATPYGVNFCKKFVADLKPLADSAIVSGLAYGIDAAAHEASLANGITTFAVVAHGLDTIYPSGHRSLAREIIKRGGAVISEYPSGTRPYRGQFLQRNRIVAALSDASVVVESPVRGGALSTANFAFEYDRQLFAVPGRLHDENSAGCNRLIARDKARIFLDTANFLEQMGWSTGEVKAAPSQTDIFDQLDPLARSICTLLRRHGEAMSLDDIFMQLGGVFSDLSSQVVELEADGILVKYPGNLYGLG